MALDATIRNQIASYTELLEQDVVITFSGDHSDSSVKMKNFVEEIVSLSDKIQLKEAVLDRTPSFKLDRHDQEVGISFAAIPLGHELASFVLALVQTSGRPPKIEEDIIKRIKAIDQKIHFESYITLSCNICPDVVQSLNMIAVLNPNVTHTIIDGTLFQAEVEEKNIMAVPTVMMNGEEFVAGRVSIIEILDQILGQEQLNIDTEVPYDILVVGGGPAGASSAIYAARKGLKVGLITDRIGGQVLETSAIENIIGTPHTEGEKFAESLNVHMQHNNIEIIDGYRVVSVEKTDMVHVVLDNDQTLQTTALIIATGARWRDVNVPGEKELKNKGVAYCPHCDGPLYKGKDVVVIGGGNSGVEAAIDLANIAKHVTVLEFADTLKADSILQDSLSTFNNVNIVKNAQTSAINGEQTVTGLNYVDRETSVEHTIDTDGVFIQIGLVPNTEFLGDALEKTPMGEIIVNAKGESSIPGIFAAGDCTNSAYKQIIISMGSGATAALGAFDYIMHNKK